jgi:hypothetical protein
VPGFSESIEGENSAHEALVNPLVNNTASSAKDVFGANRRLAGIEGYALTNAGIQTLLDTPLPGDLCGESDDYSLS